MLFIAQFLDMIISILNTADVFQLSNPSVPSDVIYDVTDLLPRTASHHGKLHKFSCKSPVMPAKTAADLTSDHDEKNHTTIAELLVRSKSLADVAAILEVSPFKNIVTSYWSSYQKVYAAAFFIHIAVMLTYSLLGVASLDCTTAAGSVTVQWSWDIEFGLAIGLVWPVCLVMYDFIKLVRTVIDMCKFGIRHTFRALRVTDGNQIVGMVALQACGFFYSTLAVMWYGLNRVCYTYQDYVLSLSLLFGWIYAITFTRGFKQIHHFSIILQQILFKDITRFAVIYVFILFAFAFAYGALIQSIPSLKLSPSDFVFLVFNWMFGMSDFVTNEIEFELRHRSEFFVWMIYVLYLIMTTVVLLNLLIAMMSSSYTAVKEQSELMWKAGSLALPLEFEAGIGSLNSSRRNLHYDSDRQRWMMTISRDELCTHTDILANRTDRLWARIDQLTESLSHLTASLNHHRASHDVHRD